MRYTLAILLLPAMLLATGLPASSYPTSVCIIPTADIMHNGSMRTEFENDGYPTVGDSDSTNYIYTQFGVTSHLEVGVDTWDTSGESDTALNAKLLLAKETDTAPAFAVGIMDTRNGGKSSKYAVSTKAFGEFRLHLGYLHSEYASGAMLGCDDEIAKGFYLLADWIAGDENFLSVGISKQFADRWALTLRYGSPNDSANDNTAAVNISYTIPLLGK
jgi:hypothetical protein